MGIEENQLATTWSIYPNPATDNFHIQSEHDIKEIKILDLNGNVIKYVANEKTSIDISDISIGLYIIQVTTDKGISSQKLIRQN